MTFNYWVWLGLQEEMPDPGNMAGRRMRCLGWFPSYPMDLRERALAGERFPLRVMPVSATHDTITRIDEGNLKGNPELHPALQDLGRQITWDASQACKAFDNPDFWFPGIDEGIEPVTDDHVHLVIWAMQRELNREPRALYGKSRAERPAAPLAELPWRIQRALAERRRYWYSLYGIGREQWLNNTWTLAGVREDPEWLPEWLTA